VECKKWLKETWLELDHGWSLTVSTTDTYDSGDPNSGKYIVTSPSLVCLTIAFYLYLYCIFELLVVSIRYVCVCGCRDTLNKLQHTLKRHKIPWIELEEGEQKYIFFVQVS